jgi:Zincin-like metallopeptidase
MIRQAVAATRVLAMTGRTRDRHSRGLRGPLALPNPLTGSAAQPVRPASRNAYFTDTVHTAVAQISRQCPDALAGVSVGIEDVPFLATPWSGDHVPLAAAVERTPDRPAQVVVYRRPLEHRAASRRGLRILVYRTIVEQLAALTGRSVEEIDPTGVADED